MLSVEVSDLGCILTVGVVRENCIIRVSVVIKLVGGVEVSPKSHPSWLVTRH